MDFTFSKHAIERIKDRGITEETVSSILNNPDSIIKTSNCKHIYQKKIKEEGSKYLFRIFVNICIQPTLIITAYKTSKIDKYEH